MQHHDSFTNAFLNNLSKNVRANSPTFSIKGLENKTSLDIKHLLSKERLQTDPTPRKSPTVFHLNMQSPTQNVIQIQLHGSEAKKQMKSPPPPPSRHEYGLQRGDRTNSHSNSEKENLKSRKEVPVHSENLKSPTLKGETKRYSLLRKMVGLDGEKKESSSTRSNQLPSPSDKVKEMLQKHSENNTIILETQREQLRDSYREMDSYQRRVLEQEKQLEAGIGTDRSDLERENMELKEMIRRLTVENQKKDERYNVLEVQHRVDIEKYRQENEEMMDKLRGMEQKLSMEMIDLIADKNRLETERMEYIEHIGEFDEKRAKLISENFKLKEEIALQEMAQENIKRTAESFKQKSRSQMAIDKKLRETLKSTLGDLAQLTEKAVQIELEHSRTVKELESKIVAKDGLIAGLEEKYKEEIEQKNREIQELKKKNNRLIIEKEGLSLSLVKQKDVPGRMKCMSVKNLVPNVDINLENTGTEENQENGESLDSGRSLRDRGNNVVMVEKLMKEKDDLRNSVRKLEAEVDVYQNKITELYHENEKLKREVSYEQAKVKEYTDNLVRQLEGLQGKDARSRSISKEHLRRPLEEARLNLNGRRHTEKGHNIHSRISLTEPDQPYMLTPREREDLSSVKTPPLKENFRVVMNDIDTNKKGGMYKDENENLNTQRTLRPERLYIEDDGSRMNTQSLTDMKTVKNAFDMHGRKSKENVVITSLDENAVFKGEGAQKPKRSQTGKSLNLLNMRSGENRPIGFINL